MYSIRQHSNTVTEKGGGKFSCLISPINNNYLLNGHNPYTVSSWAGFPSLLLSAGLVSDLASDLVTDFAADFGLSFCSVAEAGLLLTLTLSLLSLLLVGLAALLLFDVFVSPSAGLTDVEEPLAILLLTSSMAFLMADSAEVSPVKVS